MGKTGENGENVESKRMVRMVRLVRMGMVSVGEWAGRHVPFDWDERSCSMLARLPSPPPPPLSRPCGPSAVRVATVS